MTLDPAKLDPSTRAAYEVVARAEIAQLEAESAEHRALAARWDDEDATEAFEREERERLATAERSARLARDRVNGATAKVSTHLTRATQPGLSSTERAAEESLALSAFRRADEWQAMATRMTASATVHEPPVYHRQGEHSYYSDVAASISPNSPSYRDARDRLERYGKGLARDYGAEGMRARKIWREASRKQGDLRSASDAEYRALSTGSASGGALVTPLYIVADAAQYRSASPTFMDYLVTKRALPSFGMSVSVPKFTGPASVAADTENVAPSEVDPTATYQTQPVATYVGVVSASQQLHDRAGPVDWDVALYAQMRSQLDASIDAAVIAVALAGATSITRTITTALTFGQFLADVGKAAASLETTAGTRLPPSGIAAAAGIGEWLMAQTTSGGDAWFKPSLGALRTDDGVTGQAVSGIGLYLDDNIPAASSNAQLILANKGSVFLYAAEPVLDVFQEGGLAGNLEVVYRLREYAAPVGRFSAGVAVISGTGYPSVPSYI